MNRDRKANFENQRAGNTDNTHGGFASPSRMLSDGGSSVQDFGTNKGGYSQKEGVLFMRSKNNNLKKMRVELKGTEIYCYKVGEAKHRIMHSLVGTFIKEGAVEEC